MPMGILDGILMRMFGRPTGLPGRLGGIVMARGNRGMAEAVVGLLRIGPDEAVLEVGFGPGVGIALLARSAGHVSGIDPSPVMVAQARARNAAAIARGLVDLRQGSVESLPFEDGVFDAAMAINSMQVWPDATAGLREIRRVLRDGGRIGLGFTPRSGQPRERVAPTLSAAGFSGIRLDDLERGFCALARKP